ncbi:hypothetical protein NEF87_000578 [Candidatus Lokiarchaeum ossiferum]|uniref:Thoeris protein ThsB TIR-like domain-containing protein n=1 Tax=Candidatus Lokiarchaeum ossiferum TaxID=2951803 RepID=A0ABY6HLA2_9ARCH|nr:hypothetical protein NEF87_000578 [Candidatus Lokiarchaeum sp. B-35]
MKSCQIVIYLVGNASFRSKWQDAEMKLALRQNLPIFLIRIPKTTGPVPQPVNHLHAINWEPKLIISKIKEKTNSLN